MDPTGPAHERRDGEDHDGGGPAGPTVTRRQFAAGAGVALLAPLAARLTPWRTAAAPGGPPPGGDGAGRPGTGSPPTETAARAVQEGEEPPPGTDALVDWVEARWGDRLSENDLEQIRSSVAGNLRAASALREAPLENADEPAFTFRAYRGEAS